MAIDFQDSTPLYVQIVKDIKTKISTGKLETGQQLKTHKELAKEYDVSLITVKSALSSLIDDGYLFSRVGKGTFVANKEDTPTISQHDSVGLVLQDLKNPFFSLIAHMVEETAYSKRYNLLLSNSSSKIEKEEGQITHFKKMGVKGLIIATFRKKPHAPEIIRNLHNEDYPYVMVSYVADEDIWYVGTDHEGGAHMGTKHLIDLGYTKIGYINSYTNNALGEVRHTGFKRALSEYDIPYNPDFNLRPSFPNSLNGFDTGYQLGDVFNQLEHKPEAYFSYNDLTALGFIKRIQELGYRVPEDVAVVGFDDIDQADYANVPLTTIHQPVEKIGAAAIDKLINRIEGRPTEHRTIFPPTLVIRESCGASIAESVESDLKSH
ncbi:GntR family transcriptional regulator [Gracilimonas sp.]|uniref:GntR family transcriptional regulator n=1 Tax=Gracilimonas sp. TaxID=1974203 RepID=UPI0032F02FBC